MDLVSGIVVYVMLWWVILFTTLPFGVKTVEPGLKGIDQGAPKKPLILKKFLITTILATFCWMIIDYLFEAGYIDLHTL